MALTRAEQSVRRVCAVVVAAVAAYASYEHQRVFASDGGADRVGASLWPLSVDGLLLLATIGLLKPPDRANRRVRYAVRLAFVFGIAVSLAANVAAAPRLAWQPILVAGWPPVALLLAVELLAHGPGRVSEREPESAVPARAVSTAIDERPPSRPALRRDGAAISTDETARVEAPASRLAPNSGGRRSSNAEQAMWDYYQHQLAQGHTPTGAELDRAVGTNNYGRAVLAAWRRNGRLTNRTGGQTA